MEGNALPILLAHLLLRTLAAQIAELPPLPQLVALPTTGLPRIAPPLHSGAHIAVLIPYFGTLPPWLPLNFASMGGPNADDVSFFIVGDALPPVGVTVPPNVHFVSTTWGALKQRVKLHLGVEMPHDLNSIYSCKHCVYYNSDRSTVNASTIAAERVASQADKLIYHMSKVNDIKPFMAVLFPELITGATWWAWADIDIIWGDMPRFLDAAPESASFLCPLHPNPWGVMTWGPFTAWRISHNTTDVFRHSRKWLRVLTDPRPGQFDEWWGGGSSDWRMSLVVARLVREGRLAAAKVFLPVAEAKSCDDPCTWCPCGTYTFDWHAHRSTNGAGGLRVNGGTEVFMLHLATAKKGTWAPPPSVELASCIHGTLGMDLGPVGRAPVPLHRNRAPHGTGRRMSYAVRIELSVCVASPYAVGAEL